MISSRFSGILSLLGFIVILSACQSQDPAASSDHVEQEEYEVLDSLFQGAHDMDEFHGVVLVGSRGKVLFEKAYGIANRVWDIPMRKDLRFDIASVNKSFIAALILLAVEEGKVSLETPLVELFPNAESEEDFHPNITLHHMLSHTAGLPDYDAVLDDDTMEGFKRFKRKHFTNAEYLEFIRQLPTVGEPGQQFYYSNFAYHLLAIILEEIYDQSFGELLLEKICEPLGMQHTFSSSSNEEVFPNVVEAYNYVSETGSWTRNNFIDLTLGRRIFSTAGDLFLWGEAMNDDRLLSKASRDVMLTNHLQGINKNISYGYGWVIFDGAGDYGMGNLGLDANYIIHGGSTEGYKAMLYNINQGEYTVAFLSNVGDKTNEMKMARDVAQILMAEKNED